jgi:RIO kinase 1
VATDTDPDVLPRPGWPDDEAEAAIEEYVRRFRLADEPRRPTQMRRRQSLEESRERIVAGLADAPAFDEGFRMTYKPARFEDVWLLSSLRSFYEDELIVDVLAQVKGGKEASVYRCAAHPRTGQSFLAAKVYRPRKFRNLSNDAAYREGRAILAADGRPVRPTDDRIMRALGKKTAFGVQVQHTSWLMHEYTTLDLLHSAGGAVPRPFAANDNAILMGYCGDARRPAPTLKEVKLSRAQAGPLLREVLRNVELLLEHGLVHGDLSAYNVLFWEGQVTLIDFPQVVSAVGNANARAIFERDVRRVCEHFARQGAPSDPEAIAAGLWERYMEEM